MNVLKSIKDKISCTNIYLVLFFLYSLHIFGIQDEILWVWGIGGILYFGMKQKKLLLGVQGTILCIISVIYSLIYKHYFTEIRGYSWKEAIYMMALPVFMYILCRQFAYKKESKKLETALWCVGAGSLFYSLLNHGMYLKYGFPWDGRIWIEFWSGNPIYATEASFWGVFITALTGYSECCLLRREWIKGLAAWAGIIIANIINIQVGNRMVFMTTFVATVIALLMFFVINRKNRKLICNTIVLIVMIGIVIGVICYFNFDRIRQSSYYISVISRNGGIFHNVRFDMIMDTLRQIPQNLTGGGHIQPAGYYAVHNYWLQAANDTGILTLILWIIYHFIVMVDVFKLVFLERIDKKVKYMIIPMLAAVVSYTMMEQAGPGNCIYLNYYIMLSAMIHQVVEAEGRNGHSEKDELHIFT